MDIPGVCLVGGEEILFHKFSMWGYMDSTKDLNDALVDYQDHYRSNLDLLCHKFHGRVFDYDGEPSIGPATAQLILGRFCDVSDFSQGADARWPEDCVDDISISWDFARFPGASEVETNDAFEICSIFEAAFKLQIPRHTSGDSRIYCRLRRLAGSTLANSFLSSGQCSQRIRQNYNSRVNWSSQRLRESVIAHEVGHALGLRHISNTRSLMNPTNGGYTQLHSTDIDQMVRIGYDRRVTPRDPPPDDPIEDLMSATVHFQGQDYYLERVHGASLRE